MAGRDFTPVMFALEKNVVHLSAHVTFGASGAPTLDTKNSKGFCNIAQNVVSFTGTTAIGTTVSAVSSFVGLYVGMVVAGAGITAGTTIASLNAGAGTLVLSAAATAAATVPLTATGGYTLTLGTCFPNKLDTYAKLLGFDYANDLSGIPGAAATAAGSPAAPVLFITNNSVQIAKVASITFMTGTTTGAGATFATVNPASGEGMYFRIMLCNSTAV